MDTPPYIIQDGTVTCFVDQWTYPFAHGMMGRLFELAELGVITTEHVVIATDYFTIDDGHARIDWACQHDLVKMYVLACLLDFGWIHRMTLVGCSADCSVMDHVARMLDGLNCVLDYTDYMRGRSKQTPLLAVSAGGEPPI